jgi:hypothetical protein
VGDLATGLADVQALAAAEDRGDAVAVGGLDLVVDDGVGLGVVFAPLAVADRHVGAAELGEERPGDLPGVGARVVDRQVLGAVAHGQLVALDEGLHRAQVGEGRQDRDLDRTEVVLAVAKRPVELLDQVGRLQVVLVHLPVTGKQRNAAHKWCGSFVVSR